MGNRRGRVRSGLGDVYDPSYAKWRWNDLPIIPDSWRFTLDKRKAEQFDILRTLMRREEVTEVIITSFCLGKVIPP